MQSKIKDSKGITVKVSLKLKIRLGQSEKGEIGRHCFPVLNGIPLQTVTVSAIQKLTWTTTGFEMTESSNLRCLKKVKYIPKSDYSESMTIDTDTVTV